MCTQTVCFKYWGCFLNRVHHCIATLCHVFVIPLEANIAGITLKLYGPGSRCLWTVLRSIWTNDEKYRLKLKDGFLQITTHYFVRRDGAGLK